MSNATSFDRGHTFNVVVSVPLSRTEVWGSHGRPPFTTPLHNQSHIDCHEEDELKTREFQLKLEEASKEEQEIEVKLATITMKSLSVDEICKAWYDDDMDFRLSSSIGHSMLEYTQRSILLYAYIKVLNKAPIDN
ncbi:hypothetical protein V6N11_044938 [Hibiscus sabdariffa]|uniref:Uncharacterized protein n=2 Tax=Hibiscus sabdariffa TaxID=183260 RepID=A0ABR1ZHP7_9ROSI